MANKYNNICTYCAYKDYSETDLPCTACVSAPECPPPSCYIPDDGCCCHDHCEISYEDREYSTGAKRDSNEGKGRMDLLPWAAIMEVSKLCQRGAEHYGEHNVDKGIPMSSLCDSGARHLAKFIDGWDDEDHLVAAAWNILWALQMREKNPNMCDIPWKGDK